MSQGDKKSRVLGVAFLFQFITSFFSGVFLHSKLIVKGDISKTMANIANNAWMMRANIFVDMMTAMGVIFLGAILFITLRKQNEKIAVTAFGLYILEGALLAVSRIEAVNLLHISREYFTEGHPTYLLTMGRIASESMDYVGSTLSALAFCIGGLLFYYLLCKSGIISLILSLWGLLATVPCLIGTLLSILGYTVPFFIYLPYVPFELVIGVWILAKGIRRLENESCNMH